MRPVLTGDGRAPSVPVDTHVYAGYRIPLHLQIMDNPNFLSGEVDTGFIKGSMLSK